MSFRDELTTIYQIFLILHISLPTSDYAPRGISGGGGGG